MINKYININKTYNYLSPQIIEDKKNIKKSTYDVGNPDPGFGQSQKCGETKPVNGIPILSLLIIRSLMAIKIKTE